MMKAVIQCADTGPLESLVVMLRAVGYDCWVTGDDANSRLRAIGCDTVLDHHDLVRGMGYDQAITLPVATRETLRSLTGSDLYVDIKAHRAYDKIVKEWPNLERRVLWYRINGGEPEHVYRGGVSQGDEANPPCPVLTPNRWYRTEYCRRCDGDGKAHGSDRPFESSGPGTWPGPCPVCKKWYSAWPPFYKFDSHLAKHPRNRTYTPTSPVCLLHNADGWGYKDLIPAVRDLGVRVHGRGSPNGLIPHGSVYHQLQTTLAMVHLKSNDAPGYALYEALASGVPVVLPRRMIWRCKMQDLFEEGVTCLCFDRETHDPLTAADVTACRGEIKAHLEDLRDPKYNEEIGLAGHNRLKELVWREDRDAPELALWIKRNFP